MGTGRDELETLSRTELEALSRTQLVQRASSLGVNRPDVLTRPELVDEILSTTFTDERERSAARGLLGRARDLVARVVEKGLHLPDAAQRLRTPSQTTQAPQAVPEPIPTVALAQVYAHQGHRRQAQRVIEEVLQSDPHNATALALRDELAGKRPTTPEADETRMPTEEASPETKTHERNAPGPPRRKPVDVPTQDAVTVVRESGRLRVTWRIRPVTFARSRARSPDGRLVLRLAHTMTSGNGPSLSTDDVEVDRLAGTTEVPLPERSLSSHVALGWRDGSAFAVLATEQASR